MTLFKMENRRNFGFSAENPTGTKGGGTRAKDCEKLSPCIQIQPGETVTLCDTDGPGMVTHMWFTGYVGHSFILRIYWENNEQPSVEAPFSAFFGCAYDENFSDRDGNYPVLNSATMLVAPGRGFNSYFEMPFRKHCRITMENRGEKPETLFYMISGWYGEIPENSGYFHATYRQEHPVQKGRSYVILDGVHGKGCSAGVTLASGMNGHNTCWVEGEAKMYIDGDTYPTMNYTGTEDYFGGAWSFGGQTDEQGHMLEKTYCTPFMGYPFYSRDDNFHNDYFNRDCYRWHMMDPVLFEKDLRVELQQIGVCELGLFERQDDVCSVSYWYQTEPHGAFPILPCARDRWPR